MSLVCPLCVNKNIASYFRDNRRDYFQCSQCDLVFVPPEQHLSADLERAEYDKHENAIDDQGYLKFLNRTIEPLCAAISQPANGLDFGCGPAPALANEMRRRGFQLSIYDPYYYPDRQVLTRRYQFITCTEVLEHIADPKSAITTLKQCLDDDGILAIMTKRVINQERFASWHYKSDPTHIAFYSETTFGYIAKQFNLNLTIVGPDVVFLKAHHS